MYRINKTTMIVKVEESKFNPGQEEYVTEEKYELQIPDQKILDKITIESPEYWYATIDGKLFKSNQEKGVKSILFPSKDSLTWHLAEALYWRRGLIPRIGQGVGYDTTDFYEKLVKTFNIEFKQIKF